MGTPATLGGFDLGIDPRQKRGLFQSLLAASASQPALNSGSTGAPVSHRIEDDPRQHVAAMDANASMEDLESRVGTTAAPQYRPVNPDDHEAELERQYREASQPQEQEPLSLKRKIGLGIISALGGGAGVARGLENRNARFDRQQQTRQQRSESLLSQIEAERRMNEQEEGLSQRLGVQERGENLRAQMARDQQESQNQRLIETIQGQNQRQQAGFEQQSQIQADRDKQAQNLEDKRLATQLQIAGMRDQNQGTWQIDEDPQGKPIMFNSKTGETKAPPAGVQKPGTYQKTHGAANDAMNYATEYLQRGSYTGPGDEALMEKFFELAKPSSGFRMTQQQMDMLKNAQSWKNSLAAKARHAYSGTWFSDDQRKQIVDTMNQLGAAKNGGGGEQTQSLQPPGPAGPNMKWQHRSNNGKTEWRQVPAQ